MSLMWIDLTDVTDIVEYNMMCLNRNVLANSFFYLSKKDPERGFTCDLTAIAGCVQGRDPGLNLDEAAYVRLLLGSHLARYLRTKLEEDFGYTSTCGISTNKLLSKLAGAKNKPRNQTTLLALEDQDVAAFMDAHTLRSIPGIGFRTASLLETYMTGKESAADSHSFKSTVTAGDVRSSPKVSPGTLENILGGPGAERGIGSKTWALLHGVDPTEVKEARDIPSQISIEDTYGSGLGTMPQITEELHKLSYSLIRRMRVDLLAGDSSDDRLVEEKRWLARPRTLRLSIRSWHQMQSQSYNRSSRSGILPSFVFDLNLEIEHLAERLVVEGLLPLLRRLQNEKGPKWNLQLINICVANMVLGAADDKPGVGRDIANMFRNQDEALRPWKVVSSPEVPENDAEDATSGGTESEGDWETTANASCPQCGYSIPSFALPAHLRYHDMED
jgi:DNA polymerase iota